MWAEYVKLKWPSRLLAQQVASNNAINSVDEVEPVKSFGLNSGFSGIVIEGEKKAIKKAKKYNTGYIFWMNRSKLSQWNVVATIC